TIHPEQAALAAILADPLLDDTALLRRPAEADLADRDTYTCRKITIYDRWHRRRLLDRGWLRQLQRVAEEHLADAVHGTRHARIERQSHARDISRGQCQSGRSPIDHERLRGLPDAIHAYLDGRRGEGAGHLIACQSHHADAARPGPRDR